MQEPLLGNKTGDGNTSPITSRDLDPEEAETHNVARLDSSDRRRTSYLSQQSDDQYDQVLQHFLPSTSDQHESTATSSLLGNAPTSFQSVARRVMLMQKLKKQQSSRQTQGGSPTAPRRRNSAAKNKLRRHRKNNTSTAAELLDQIRDVNYTTEASRGDLAPYAAFPQTGTTDAAVHASTIFHSAGIGVSSSSASVTEESTDAQSEREEEEEEEARHRGDTLPVVAMDTHQRSTTYGAIAPTKTKFGNFPTVSGITRSPPSSSSFWSKFCRCTRRCWPFDSPLDVAKHLGQVLYASYCLRLACPLFVAAWLLYYGAGNPPWNFIPGTARSAWLLNFFGRQVITLELARITQWILLDCVLLGSRTVAHSLGPFVTMTAVQSKGLPFVMIAWAGWDLLILQGEGDFQAHWLYWTGVRLYNPKTSSSGEYILTSNMYWRFLLSMIMAGITITAKRMFLTVRFGRRTLVDFKPRLEKLLANMVLVGEIADLAVVNCMDEEFPFGKNFGKASDRNESIDCSHCIYHKLSKCSFESEDLPFEVISWITFNEDGSPDVAKLKALRRLFHPDVHNNLPLLAFVQSCDMVYKRFRYFMASVSNASVIDNQLERILNYFFWLLLAMMVLFMMQIDPWPILLSMTSLLVSVSFALGPSVSKYVEGILLIAVRRPFDLGDRILINSTESADSPGAPMGWFVEDITLSSTTIRFSKTNEVATVSNFAMSQSKIVNCQRSPSAVLFFNLKLHRRILEDSNLETLQDELRKYVHNNPRVWDSMLFIRQDFIGGISATPGTNWSPHILDADYQFVILSLCFQHRLGWQSSARIMITRGELIRHIYDICLKLGVQYDDPAPRRIKVQNVNEILNPSSGVGQQQQSDPFNQPVSGQLSRGGNQGNPF